MPEKIDNTDSQILRMIEELGPQSTAYIIMNRDRAGEPFMSISETTKRLKGLEFRDFLTYKPEHSSVTESGKAFLAQFQGGSADEIKILRAIIEMEGGRMYELKDKFTKVQFTGPIEPSFESINKHFLSHKVQHEINPEVIKTIVEGLIKRGFLLHQLAKWELTEAGKCLLTPIEETRAKLGTVLQFPGIID